MKKNKAIIWGILIFIAAAGLLVFAIRPDLAIFTVPVWKWIIAFLLVYCIIWKIVGGWRLTTRITVFLPLALLFMLFEKEIGTAAGLGADFVNNWILLAAAVLLDIGVYFIFRNKNQKNFSDFHFTNKGKICSGGSGENGGEGERSANGQSYWFRMGDNVCYIDACRPFARVNNRLGELNVYYQNIDVGDLSQPLELNVDNSLGETTVHIPRNWHVELDTGSSSMGDVNCRQDADVTIRTITIKVNNHMGEVNIASDD